MIQGTRAWTFGAVFPKDVELIWRQLPAPVYVGFLFTFGFIASQKYFVIHRFESTAFPRRPL